MIRNNITEVAYNVQTTVDAKNNITVDYKVTNENDSKAMVNMVQRAKSILRTNEFTVLYDKGFHTCSCKSEYFAFSLHVMFSTA